jgi:hypothetical protein
MFFFSLVWLDPEINNWPPGSGSIILLLRIPNSVITDPVPNPDPAPYVEDKKKFLEKIQQFIMIRYLIDNILLSVVTKMSVSYPDPAGSVINILLNPDKYP